MDTNFKHIELFDKIIDGKASSKLRKAFELKRKKEPEFEQAFQEHLMARKSIRQEGRKILKSDLAYLHSKIDAKDIKEYTPKGGSSAVKIVIKLLVILAVVAGGYFAYKAGYLDKIFKKEEVHQPEIKEEPKEQLKESIPQKEEEPIEEKTQVITYDTIYEVIRDTIITIDTIYEEHSDVGSGPRKRLLKEYEDSMNFIVLSGSEVYKGKANSTKLGPPVAGSSSDDIESNVAESQSNE